MNYTKRLTHTLKLLLATVFAVSLPLSANANTIYDEASGLWFETNSDGTTCFVKKVTAEYIYPKESYVIPSTVTYKNTEYTVTGIGTRAFDGCTSLTSIAIPSSVTSIKNYAFRKCTALTKVEISDLEAWCKIDFNEEYSNPLVYAGHLFLNGEEITVSY